MPTATPVPTATPEPVNPRAYFGRPVPIGVSSGNEYLVEFDGDLFCTVGTITARLIDNDGNIYAASNNHVYALENGLNVKDDDGEDVDTIIGSAVLQQGRVDMSAGCGTPEEIADSEIGTLTAFVPISFSGDNRVDAAIALSDTDLLGNATPSDGYGTPTSSTVPMTDLFFRQTVLKYGRTTGFTSGNVDAINATVNITYDGGTARFVGQIIVKGRDFLLSGDSGSLLVTENNEPIGLLFAGSNRGPGYAMANQIDDVLSELSAELGKTLTIDGSSP